MAGGKYDKLAGKTRPGTYINFESDRNDTVGNSERGIVLLPLIGYDFGPAKTPITLTAAAPDAYSVELGRSVYDATNDKMRLIREAFKKASKVIVYITESGTAATGTAAPLLALANQILSAFGKSLLPIESSTVEQLVTTGITTVTALINWWYNNSFTQAAIEGDKTYENVKNQIH